MIQINNLNYSYPGTGQLFRSLNCDFKPGNIYGLLGRNGAGKTTLLKIIAGLLISENDSCLVLEHPSSSRIPEILSNIYYLPEEFYTPTLPVDGYIRHLSPFYPRFDHGKMDALLREFDLPAAGRLQAFSYGMKKKFLIAFAMSSGARVLLLDEPSNGLDIPSKSQLRKVLAGSLMDDQLMIISTHQVRDMKNLIDPIVILDGGRILLNSNLESIGSRLSVTRDGGGVTAGEVLYSEEVFGAETKVVVNNTGVRGEVPDLELLFNTVIGRPDYFLEHFGEEA